MTTTPDQETGGRDTPLYGTAPTLAAVCPEHGYPTGYTFECDCCGTFFEDAGDWEVHAHEEYTDILVAEEAMTVRYRTGEEVDVFAAMQAVVEDVDEENVVYETTGNPNVYHLYPDCTHFPKTYDTTPAGQTRRRCCSACQKRRTEEIFDE